LFDLAALTGGAFFGLTLTATGAFFLTGSEGRALTVAFLGLDAALDCFGADRDVLVAGADFFGVALRTGAFSAAEFFGLGLGRAVLTLNLRLAEDFEEALRGTGREGVFLLAPLITGSLM
jgi:hypothetical protein